jgi:hypothetical protein
MKMSGWEQERRNEDIPSFLRRIKNFLLPRKTIRTYGGAQRRASSPREGQDPPVNRTTERPTDMAFTPSKDAKRREREQKKMDKRLAREEEKAQKLAAQRAAEEAAANDPSNMTEAEIQAKLEADFEAELAAEAAA